MQNIVKDQLFLQPGFLAVSHSPMLLCSVCGIGLIITVWDRHKKVGAMAHCFFDKPLFREKETNYHVTGAMRNIAVYLKRKNHSGAIDVSLFGVGSRGGVVLKRLSKSISRVRKICSKADYRIVSEDLGGTRGRKVIFNTFSGETITLKTDVRQADWHLPALVAGGVVNG